MKDLAINDEQAASVSNDQGNSAMASDGAIAHQHWQQIKAELQQDLEKMQFVNAISKCAIEVVNRASTVFANNAIGQCHVNVHDQVKQFGGKQVFGWQIAGEMTEGVAMKGCICAVFHSNWLDDNDVLWDITAETQKTRLFLPDPVRAFDFDKAMGYNNRLAFLSKGLPANTSHKLVRNKTYYTALGHISRDRGFEKYTVPKSREAMLAALPSKYVVNIAGKNQITEDGMKWLALKFTVRFGG